MGSSRTGVGTGVRHRPNGFEASEGSVAVVSVDPVVEEELLLSVEQCRERRRKGGIGRRYLGKGATTPCESDGLRNRALIMVCDGCSLRLISGR